MDAGRGTKRASSASIDWKLASGPEITENRVEELRDAFQIAWYISLGMTPDDVGSLLGMSRATVYRQIRVAEAEGLLDTSPRCALPWGPGAGELLASVLMADLGEEVRAVFPREMAPAEVLVTSVRGVPNVRDEGFRAISRRVSTAAARRLAAAMMVDTRIVGIAYGHHCGHLSKSLPGGITQRLDPSHAAECQFFPLVGSLGAREVAEALGLPEMSAESNAIRATRNMEVYGVEPGAEDVKLQRPPQVTQPCVIPAGVWNKPPMMHAAWEILSMDASIQHIFGNEWCEWRLSRGSTPLPENASGLLHQAHCLVTGIGDVQQSRHLALIKLYPSLRADAESAGACADICGYMFCGRDDYEAHRGQLDEVNHRIVAPTLEDYVRATRRARLRDEGLGTMVLASGGGEEEFSKAKARAISAAISHGAINILCIDEVVARAIVNLNTPAEPLT